MKNIATRIINSLKNEGIYATYLKMHAIITDPLFDLRYGFDTGSIVELDRLTIKSENRIYGVHYQPTKVIFLKKFLKHIQHLLPSHAVLVDLGCGKGRVLLVASEFGFKELRGIEFAHELCEAARFNIEIYKSHNPTNIVFNIIESDVAQYSFQPDENVYFMFNPFNEIVMEKVLNDICISLQIQPRKILIIYLNPTCDKLIKSFPGIRKIGDFYYGYHFTVYSNYAD